MAEISPENLNKVQHDSLKGRELQVVIGHKSQAFVFPSQLVDPFNEASVETRKKRTRFFFSKPHTGVLRNQRLNPRFTLADSSPYLKAEIKVSSQLGEFNFETRQLVDLSHTSMSLFLDRAQGLVLPGDKVKVLVLYHQNEIVLETEGSIFRTDMNRVSDQVGNSYFAVIMLKRVAVPAQGSHPDPNASGTGVRVDRSKAFVEAHHPVLQGYKFSGEILFLSTSSLSFSVEKPEVPFLTGLILNDIYIHIPPDDLKLKACIKITHCTEEKDAEGNRCVVWGEFLGMSIDLIKAVNRLKDSLVDLHLVEAKREDCERLLEFFFESGFIYSAKRKLLQKYAAGVKRTNLKLLQSNSPIIKKVIFKDNQEIKGHISALRFFDRAWLIQHMTTHNTTGTAIGRAILISISNFFQDSSANKKVDTNFVTCYYQPGNLYPEVIFGETQRIVANPNICDITDLDFCILAAAETGPKTRKKKPGIECHEALPGDLVNLERLLVTQGQYFPIRIEGLTAEGLTKLEVSPEYEKLGLYRKRRVFAARHPGGGEAVYAVCNYASPGCNLSELTNSFRVYYSPSEIGPDSAVEMVNALSWQVLASYKETEMNAPVLLLGPHQPTPDPFKRTRKYRYWFFDAAYCDLFKKTSESNISNVKEILKRLKAETAVKKDASYAPV